MDLRCSFCGKKQADVRLIAGPRGVYICNLCVALCTEILAHDTSPNTPLAPEPAEQCADQEPPGRSVEPGGWVRTVISS